MMHEKVLQELHDGPVGGHFGGDTTTPPNPTGLFWNCSCQYIFFYFEGCFGALNSVFLACHCQFADKVRF
jgi:hypothetical protein